ncbi:MULTISPECIES: helix-turn-helix domain-containing protein [Bacillaceae]|uniref:Helix-turn-helix domain-containing protein n=1 Tax=Bacillus methanolicus (strain MGA3 / ATCC 53907) TaxID=796606 RepID=I3E3K6_BACMM|nr:MULTISPECIES: helix-turn-helix domain-containing protein [Bacillaceae]AIE58850.1 hypothetical protein BMMGA3_01900 [Bacillus methanolicus MGA3]EIJ81077.1 hypothetical protein MGA3_12330 [Bacillus methanolicus MGA3]
MVWVMERLVNMSKESISENHFVAVPNSLRKCIGLSANDKDVLYDILWSINDNESCFPSKSTIAERLNIGESTVGRSLNKLHSMYFLNIENRVGTSNLYSICLLEDNPYLIISELTHWYKKRYKTVDVPKNFCKSKVSKAISKYLAEKHKEYADRLFDCCSNEDYNSVLENFLEEMNKYVVNATNVKIEYKWNKEVPLF